MKELCVIHLSDLHIDSIEDPNLALVRDGLKVDLENIIKKNNLDINAIVISGDIINRGNVKSYEIAKNTIKELLDLTHLSNEQLVIVPGNHDIKRDAIRNMIIEKNDINDVNFQENEWEHIKLSYKEYLSFINETMTIDERFTDETFGIKDINGKNMKARFILLDTAWSTKGNEDYRNLKLGRWQLECIKKSILDDEERDLYIAVTHHPLEWLTVEEESLVKDYLTDPKKLPVDVILHGHIHDAKLKVETNPDGSLVSLVSGIGYPKIKERDAGQPKIESCRYSIYKFDINNNNIECWCRISEKHGKFNPDFSLYSSYDENGCYSLPLRTKQKKVVLNDQEKNLEKELEFDAVPVTAGWTGRAKQIKELLNEDYSVSIISGVGGQGKSALAAEFLRRYSRGENKLFDIGLWIDCRELPETIHLRLVELMEVLSDGRESVALYKDEKLKDTIIRFYNYLKKNKMIVVFDNIDAYVDMREQAVIGELLDVFNMALNKEHKSLVIMTCRIPINDNRANYLPINLNGLTEEEGVEFFRKRGIELNDEFNIKQCKVLVNSTKGHPLWMGLIAGQIKFNNLSLKTCVQQFNENNFGSSIKVREYFQSIWEGLSGKINKLCQVIVRHLVEATKPLNEDQIQEILIKESNFKNISKALTRVSDLGLLESHEEVNSGQILYQVHPLVREFIHNTYSIEEQRPIVCKVLYLFLNHKIIDTLFNDKNKFEKMSVKVDNSKVLVDSIDTCINSRNYEEALQLMYNSYEILRNAGFHLDLASLGCRILEHIDWEKEGIAIVQRKAQFLANLIDVLSLIGKKSEMNKCLKRYKSFVDIDTISYTLYLSIEILVLWREQEFKKALESVQEFKELSKIITEKSWEYQNVKYTEALLLRDTGAYKNALSIFNDAEASGDNCGNRGRCYQMMGDNKLALKYYHKSLKLLENENTLLANSNIGYALFWISQIFYSINKIYESSLFLYLAEKTWKKFSPGLLSDLKSLKDSISKEEVYIQDKERESKAIWDDFIKRSDNDLESLLN